jgi:hypothetical protein
MSRFLTIVALGRQAHGPRRWLALLCVSLLAVGLPATSQAAQKLTVCAHGCDYTTIAAAIQAASPGQTIKVRAGTYSENLTIDKALTIVGAGVGQTIVTSAISHQPVLAVTGHPVYLSDLTVTGAQRSVDGAISNAAGAVLNIEDVKVTRNANEGVGGGISNSGRLTLTDSTISDNDAGRGGSGGGIENDGTMTIRDSRISNNSATVNGGGILNSGSLTLIDSTVSGNSGSTLHGSGGGLYLSAGSTMIRGSQIVNNSASDAGAIYSAAGSTVKLVQTTVRGNSKPQCEPITVC